MKFAIYLSLALLATVVLAKEVPLSLEEREVREVHFKEADLLSRDKRGLFDFIVHAKDIIEGIGGMAKGIEEAIKKVAVVVDKVAGQASAAAAAQAKSG